MPLYGLTSDNSIRRERPLVRDVSDGTKMLASLGRCCMKQVRLGQDKDPILKERALTGNTILLAQPTGDVPLLELPPPKDALTGTLNVIFTRSVDELQLAHGAVVDRAKCTQLVTDRKECCPVFKDVKINHDGAADLLALRTCFRRTASPTTSSIAC